jgi:hypothetical protein
MLKSFTIPVCLAMMLVVADSQANGQVIREGARRTGEAVAEGSRAVVRGTREAVERTGEATRDVIDNNTEAARAQVDRQQRSELQLDSAESATADVGGDINASARAGAGPAEVQADAGINPDQQQFGESNEAQLQRDRDAPGLQGQYESGYRGLNEEQGYAAGQPQAGQAVYGGRAYRLRFDRNGREFICVGGRPVYFDDQQGGQPQERQAYKLSDEPKNQPGQVNQHEMHQQRRDGQMIQRSGQYQRNLQGGTYQQGQAPAPPAPPAPLRSDLNGSPPASPSLNADTNISAEQQTSLDESADVDADAQSSASADAAADADADLENQDESSSSSNAGDQPASGSLND